MDIGSLSRLRNIFSTNETSTVRRNTDSSADRDANGRRHYEESRPRPSQLSAEQEDAAVAKLNALASFASAGLKAELVRGEGQVTHVRVIDSSGLVVRNVPYEQIVDLYLDRNSENGTGRLLKRAA